MRSRSVSAAMSQLKAYPTRVVATVLAIVLGVGFVAATLVFGATYQADLGAGVSARFVAADVVITNNGVEDQQQLLAATRDFPGVAAAEEQPEAWLNFSSDAARGTMRVSTLPADERLRWFGLTAGAWPDTAGQIMVDESTAAGSNLQLGSAVTLTGYDDQLTTVTVVGIADTSASVFSGGQSQAFATPQLINRVMPSSNYGTVVAIADPGTSADQLRDSIAAASPVELTVRTSEQQIADELADITGGAMILTIVLLGFAVTAVVASGIVIANTFTILLTQRRRHIALTRCIGGSRRQVRREVLAEAGLVGAIGSLIGVAVGVGVGGLGAALAGLNGAGLVLPVLPLILTGVGGIGFTLIAAYAPASRAMRVAPLAALRPVSDDAEQRRSSILRWCVAGGLIVVGGLALAAGVLQPSLVLAMGGGALSACGILLLTRTFLPATIRLVGRTAGVFGPPGRLAAANAHRNPGRAAATTAALMLGVGLIVTLQVGASSAQASLDRAYSVRYPVDVSVAGTGGPVSPAVQDAIAATAGVRTSAGLPGTTVIWASVIGDDETGSAGNGGAETGTGDAGESSLTAGMTILGVDDRAAATLSAIPAGLTDGAVIVPGYLLSSGWSVGDRISVTTATGSAEFTVAAGSLAQQGVEGASLITTAAGLQQLAPDAPTLAVWAAMESGADVEKVTADLNRVIAAEPDLLLGGSAPERAAMASALGTIITLATGLLAVAVIIAIVGIGNTLGLSVIERTRESALLRALGLHRRQLRLMLAVEAALLAVVGAAVGVAAGIGYGWIGAASAFGEAGQAIVLDIPWLQLGVVLALAVVAALIASVLPALRAAQATPTQALAEV